MNGGLYMENLTQPLNDPAGPLTPERPSLLVRASILALVPILLVLALPLLLLLILAIYLLAMLQGTKVIVFTWTNKREPFEPEFQKPHFLERDVPVKVLTDESNPPSKG